jgi:hypothetical protein
MALLGTQRTWPLPVGGVLLLLGLGSLVGYATTGGDADGTGELEYRIDVKPTVMTFAYKVYGNEDAADGKYWLARIRAENEGDAPLDDLRVSYRVPGYLDSWTTPQSTAQLLPGQTASLAIYPQFPRSLTTIRSRTPATLEVKLAWKENGEDRERVESRPFEFRGVSQFEYTSLPSNEVLTWYDVYDNKELAAAFITPDDPIVRQYLGKISETKGGLPIVNNAEELGKVMRSIYTFMTDTGMTYAGSDGVPDTLNDVQSFTQSIRLPRQVINENSGLCIDLAMLWAALGKAAGAKAYLVLVPGHCYPVLVANDGSIVPIEATGIGGSNLGGVMSFEKAVEAGVKQWKQLQEGKTIGMVVDINEEQSRGIRPPDFEAADIAALAKMLDDRVKNATNRGGGQRGGGGGGQLVDGGGRGSLPPPNNDNNANGWPTVTVANLTVPYPPQFQPNQMIVQQVQPMLPSYLFSASDQTQTRSVDVYNFGNASPQQAMNQLVSFAGQFGMQMQFAGSQQTQFAGQQAQFSVVAVASPTAQMSGGMYFIPTRQGLVGIAVTGPSSDASWQQTAQAIAGAARAQ